MVSPPGRTAPFLLAISLTLLTQTASAVPPVPGKHGPFGPPEGFSKARLRPDFAALPGRGEHIKLEAQANYNVLAVRVAFSDTPIDSSTAYYDRLLFFMNQYWSQVSGGQITLTPTLWDSVFTLPHPMAYYGDDARFQERVVFMVRDMVQLADSTVKLADEELSEARERFAAGVTDNLEVVQAQGSLVNAQNQYVSSLYVHNLAKLTLARVVGEARQNAATYLGGK